MAAPTAVLPTRAAIGVNANPADTPEADTPETPAVALDRLHLAQWLSPAFPVGGFAYSQGIETAIVARDVHDAATMRDWVSTVLQAGSPRTDAILLARGRDPGADLDALADLARAYATSAERLEEMLDQGAAFGAMIGAITGTIPPALPYPLAIAHATRPLDVPTTEVLALFLHGQAAQMISAVVRFMPLGQSDGQRVLATLAPMITTLSSLLSRLPLDDICTFTPRADLATMAHETLAVRIFRT